MIVGVGNWASTVNALEALEEQTPSSATTVYEVPGMVPVITPPTFAVGPQVRKYMSVFHRNYLL